MKVLYIVRGIPGSGKTTYAEGLGLKHHYETDQFWGEDYAFDPSRLREAHQWCQDVTETALADGNDVVVSNTFIRQWEIEPSLSISAGGVISRFTTCQTRSLRRWRGSLKSMLGGDNGIF